MHLSKKKKLALAWFAPAAAVVAVGAVTSTIFIFDEKHQNNVLNNTENISPKSFSESQDSYLVFNPKDFDVNFFLYNIGNSVFLNDVFSFTKNVNGQEILLEKIVDKDSSGNIKKIYWLDKKTNVSFEIKEMKSNLSLTNENYSFDLTINKKFKNTTHTYSRTILIPKSSFASPEDSKKNFNAQATSIINDIFVSQNLKISVEEAKKETISTIDQITSSKDLDVTNKDNDILLETISTQEATSYLLGNEEFNYLGKKVGFSIPVTKTASAKTGDKLIFSSIDAYKFTNGSFDKLSKLFVFLKNEYKNGHLTYLPELTTEESNGLTGEDAILDRRIQKLIFNPSKNSYKTDDKGNKIPLDNHQAVVVKVQLDNTFTYMVSWTNLFEVTSSIVTGATELTMVAGTNNGTVLTSEDLLNPKNYPYIIPSEKPKSGLEYKVVKVEFESNDTYRTKPIATVEIRSSEVNEVKTYKTTIVSGFKSDAYVQMEKEIKAVAGENYANLSKLIPSIQLKEGINHKDFANSNISNMEYLVTQIDITSPGGITSVKYTPVFARISGDLLEVRFKLSSVNDETNFWKVYGTEQTVTSTLKLNLSQTP